MFSIKTLAAFGSIFILSSCGLMPNAQNQQTQAMIKTANDNLGNCVSANVNNRNLAQCARNFYMEIQAMPSNDYGKPAALNMATSLYQSSLRFDKGQLNRDQMGYEIMQITNKFNADLEDGRRRTVAENMEASRIRQQAWRDFNEAIKPPAFAPAPCNGGMLNSRNNG